MQLVSLYKSTQLSLVGLIFRNRKMCNTPCWCLAHSWILTSYPPYSSFKNYFPKFKILLPKYFFQNTLNNVFSRKPVSFRLLRVTVSQNFVSVFNIPISINYQSNTSTSIRFACRKFWIVAAQLYGLHAPRRRWIWRIWRQDSRTCQTSTRRITHFPISKNQAYQWQLSRLIQRY